MNSPESSGTVSQYKMGEHFCLKWNNHQENLTGIMTKLLDEQKFVDVSLVCEMKTFKAHQTVLSASSPYFEQVLEENPHPHPIVILRDVKEAEMSALLQYMYRGEVNVRDHELPAFLQIARALQVRGLSENVKKDVSGGNDELREAVAVADEREPQPQPLMPQNTRALSESPQNLAPQSKRRRVSISCNSEPPPNHERHSADSQPLSPVAVVCKTNANQKPSSSMSSYSDNLSDVQFVDTSTPSTPAIKQETEGVSAQSDPEQYHLNHSIHMQQPEASAISDSDLSICRKSLTPSAGFPTSDLTSLKHDGGKPWHIKYAFDKIEGFGYKCKICGQLKQHVRNHYLKHFPEHHECHLCGRTYTRKDNLNSHLKRDHMQRVRSGGYRRRRSCSSMPKPEFPALKYFTRDVYSHIKYTGTSLPLAPLPPQPSLSDPMDLSARPPATASLHNPSPCAPMYDILPSFYNYFRN